MKKSLQKCLHPLLAKNNLAMVLVDDAATEESISAALNYIVDLEDINEAASLDTVGWVYYKAVKLIVQLKF